VRLLVRFPFGRLSRPSFGRLSIWALPLLENATSLRRACADAIVIGCLQCTRFEMVVGGLRPQRDELRAAKEAVLVQHSLWNESPDVKARLVIDWQIPRSLLIGYARD
jgi:hypothetical protein